MGASCRLSSILRAEITISPRNALDCADATVAAPMPHITDAAARSQGVNLFTVVLLKPWLLNGPSSAGPIPAAVLLELQISGQSCGETAQLSTLRVKRRGKRSYFAIMWCTETTVASGREGFSVTFS